MSRKVLITGTTSGLGKALMEKYLALGWDVTAVNRRITTDLEEQFPSVLFLQTDITDVKLVLELCYSLGQRNRKPDVLILNAGINRIDNNAQLEMDKFKDVFDTNLYGVLNFIRSAQKLEWEAKIVGISSTSTIVPNHQNLGYYISKVSINKIFKLLTLVDKKRIYKVVILGPTDTNLNHLLPTQQGLQKIIFDFLTLSTKEAAGRATLFIDSKARVLYPTFKTTIFYFILKALLICMPRLYYKPHQKKETEL